MLITQKDEKSRTSAGTAQQHIRARADRLLFSSELLPPGQPSNSGLYKYQSRKPNNQIWLKFSLKYHQNGASEPEAG